jgi:hypothetical protein
MDWGRKLHGIPPLGCGQQGGFSRSGETSRHRSQLYQMVT